MRIFFNFFLMIFIGNFVIAQGKNSNKKTKQPASLSLDSENSNTQVSSSQKEPKPKYKNKHAVTLDYNSWFETLKINDTANNTYSDSKSQYYGVSINYDYTVYQENTGYALQVGFIQGNTQVGTKGSSSYYQRRIPWNGTRAGGRYFVRVNNKIDIGPALLAQFKQTNWPSEGNFQVVPQTNPQFFLFLDTRWRVSYPVELIQAFGVHSRDYSMVWRLGVNYTLN